MFTNFDSARDLALALVPVAGIFIALAAITKRDAIFDAGRRCRREFATNLAIAFLDSLIVLPIVAIPSLWLVNIIGIPSGLSTFWDGVPLILTCVAAVVVGDLVGYWRHRLEHSPTLWPAHATHHSDEAMNWLTLLRMHPINRFSTVTIDMTVLALCGFPPVAVGFNLLVRHWWGFFVHADLPWTLGWADRVLISPAAHKVHHARDEGLAGHNFATVFTFWDRLWRTWRDPRDLLDVQTGIETGSLLVHGELLRPIFAFYEKLLGGSRQRLAKAITPPA